MQPDLINTILAHYPALTAIYLFGSRAGEEARQDSDWDIALLFPGGVHAPAHLAMTELHEDLEKLCKGTVDLVDMRRVSTLLQKEIIFQGKRIYDDGTGGADAFEILVMSLYQDLNEERKDIIRDGIKSGSFYNV